MRKILTLNKNFDCNISSKSVIRYNNVLWICDTTWTDPDSGKIKVLISSLNNQELIEDYCFDKMMWGVR